MPPKQPGGWNFRKFRGRRSFSSGTVTWLTRRGPEGGGREPARGRPLIRPWRTRKLSVMATDVPGTTEGDDALIAVIVRRGESDRAMRAAHQAFEMLYLRHGPLLRAFLSGRVARADLDDLHQDVWRKIWARLPDRYRPGNFRAWLHQVARALIIDQHRRQKPEAMSHETEDLADGGKYHPEDHLVERERAEAFRRCLDGLEARAATWPGRGSGVRAMPMPAGGWG